MKTNELYNFTNIHEKLNCSYPSTLEYFLFLFLHVAIVFPGWKWHTNEPKDCNRGWCGGWGRGIQLHLWAQIKQFFLPTEAIPQLNLAKVWLNGFTHTETYTHMHSYCCTDGLDKFLTYSMGQIHLKKKNQLYTINFYLDHSATSSCFSEKVQEVKFVNVSKLWLQKKKIMCSGVTSVKFNCFLSTTAVGSSLEELSSHLYARASQANSGFVFSGFLPRSLHLFPPLGPIAERSPR